MNWRKWRTVNPILVKEIRSRMRGPRPFITLTGILLLMGVVSYGIYLVSANSMAYSPNPLSPQIGQALFVGIALLELIMVCAITPAVTAGSISGEEERETMEMLLATPLSAHRIVLGKLLSALSFVFLLIFAAIPMSSLVFMFGGVTIRQMVKMLLVLIVVAVHFGMGGLFLSAWLRRTGRSTVSAYLIVFGTLFGTLLLYTFVGIITSQEPPRGLLALNPVSAMFSALMPADPTLSGMDILSGISILLSGNIWMVDSQFGLSGIPRPLYQYSVASYAALTLVLYFLTVGFIHPTRRWALNRKDRRIAVIALLLLALLGSLAFGLTAGRYENFEGNLLQDAFQPQPVPVGAVQVEPAISIVPDPIEPTLLFTPTPLPVLLLTPGQEARVAMLTQAIRQTYETMIADEGLTFEIGTLFIRQEQQTSGGESFIVPDMQSELIRKLEDISVDFQWYDPMQPGPTPGSTLGSPGEGFLEFSLIEANETEIVLQIRIYVLAATDDEGFDPFETQEQVRFELSDGVWELQ
ncbi:MAG: ABC transporter permease subunit [Anaerolineales bacterium]|jgi:ABC-type transport system involved in multi-copper enzyme maturation permease subunit